MSYKKSYKNDISNHIQKKHIQITIKQFMESEFRSFYFKIWKYKSGTFDMQVSYICAGIFVTAPPECGRYGSRCIWRRERAAVCNVSENARGSAKIPRCRDAWVNELSDGAWLPPAGHVPAAGEGQALLEGRDWGPFADRRVPFRGPCTDDTL